MERPSYRLNDPYPIPEGLTPNRHYARILANNFSGPSSELTAVTQYIYHHLEAQGTSGDAARCLRGIAIVEMHHLDLLGGCIRQLGLNPQYRYFRGNMTRPWNASFVSAGGTLREMIQTDIQGEISAIRHYEAAIERIHDDQIQALLLRIIRDEELHIAALRALL